MKKILSERNIVVFLFIIVLVTFTLAQEATKKMEKRLLGTASVSVVPASAAVAQNHK